MADEQPYAIQVEDPTKGSDPAGITTGKWGAGFCSCFQDVVPNCCMVYFCPCVTFGQITARMGIGNYSSTVLLFTLLLAVSWFAGLGYLVLVIWVMQVRGKVRERFHISGGTCDDYCLSCCCMCCTLAQMATHVKSYKPGSCEFRPVADTLPPYSS